MSVGIKNSPKDLARYEGTRARCPRCAKGPMVTDSSGAELFCSNCGFVLKEQIVDTGREWRAFSTEEANQRAHTGAPSSLALHDMGLSTVIGFENKDASGKLLPAAMRTQIERLRTWDGRSQVHESADRNRRQAFSELSLLVDKLNVNSLVVEKAAYIYRRALERGLIRGRSISGMIAASLYAACRDTETPRNLKDLSLISNIKKKDLARCYRLLYNELDLRVPVVDPVKLLARIASKAGVQEKTKRRAIEILRRTIETNGSAGKGPMGLAATALYVASVMENDNVTQKVLAEAAGVTEVTIRNRYKGLKAAMKI
ncbi:MAG TPA: TFIIB-type zinc ribbon-containing protein [Nitrososphaerales archaeon]|nr:TFIIB-type zinc ribbon-containing protein [Nitrososphaerales archaeon]